MTNKDPLQDREVIERVLRGEHDEFRHIVSRYQNLLYRMIIRQVADHDAALELTQEVFLRAFRGLHGFNHRAELSTWLTRIALNVARSYFSSRQFRERRQTLPLSDAGEPATPTADERYNEAEILHLKEAIGTLKPKYREVVVLCYLERKSYGEAAGILGIPEGTVCSRLHNALKHLRKAYSRKR